jgi:hypothetical protein
MELVGIAALFVVLAVLAAVPLLILLNTGPGRGKRPSS